MMILIPGTSVLSSRYRKCSQEFYLEQNRQQLSLYLFKETAGPSWRWGLKFSAFSSAVGTPAMCISGIFVEQAGMCRCVPSAFSSGFQMNTPANDLSPAADRLLLRLWLLSLPRMLTLSGYLTLQAPYITCTHLSNGFCWNIFDWQHDASS